MMKMIKNFQTLFEPFAIHDNGDDNDTNNYCSMKLDYFGQKNP